MQIDTLTLDLVVKISQVVVAIVVGYVAWLARRDAKRNSISGLLKAVADLREKAIEQFASQLTAVLSPHSDFSAKPMEYKRIIIGQLRDRYDAKRGLDIAYRKLLTEADTAWNFGHTLQRQLTGMNPDGDEQFNKLFAELEQKHLQTNEANA